MKRQIAAGVAVLLAAGTLACGGEEGTGGDWPPAAQEQQQPDVSDEELQAFAEATGQLRELAEQAKTDIQQAEGQQEAEQVRQEFHRERAEIVEEAGLDTARYTEIRQAIESNAEVRERYLEFQ